MGGDCNCQRENRAFTPSMHILCDRAVFLRYKRHLWQVLSTSTILNRQESGSSFCLIQGLSDQWRPRAVGPGRDSAGGPAGVPGTSVDELCFSVHAKQRSRSVHRSLLPSRGALLICLELGVVRIQFAMHEVGPLASFCDKRPSELIESYCIIW